MDPPPYPPELSATAYEFLNLIFPRNPRKRANVCQLLRHPFITNADVIDLTASHQLLSNEDRVRIVKQASNVRNEHNEEVASITSPQSVKPMIELDSSIDDSEYITNGHNNKIPFNFVSKQTGDQSKGPDLYVQEKKGGDE